MCLFSLRKLFCDFCTIVPPTGARSSSTKNCGWAVARRRRGSTITVQASVSVALSVVRFQPNEASPAVEKDYRVRKRPTRILVPKPLPSELKKRETRRFTASLAHVYSYSEAAHVSI